LRAIAIQRLTSGSRARTGAIVEGFDDKGRVDLREAPRTLFSWNAPAPIVVGNVIVVGGQPIAIGTADINKASLTGNVRGFDVRTGKLLWTFRTVPRDAEPGVETWENESWRVGGKTKVWSAFSADEKLGLVYLPLSAPPSGCQRASNSRSRSFGTSSISANSSSIVHDSLPR
jgi:quinoprotein glucose dehydrogenase